ncbi:unnamed protein product [Penicillium roqueforti FM164]|uniref:Genomic scaffold, ProqFM164S03 n=1 Tax=Penicillium roqueforti (strain FM164) TaxID=1365484 RepID=W6QFP6_PENRF|nr:unnamed protein product [Penicillium roqueforti FM164]
MDVYVSSKVGKEWTKSGWFLLSHVSGYEIPCKSDVPTCGTVRYVLMNPCMGAVMRHDGSLILGRA